ncbi:MAG: hypothetical protein N3A61_06280 [Ignavibacteria bacterium]|nr:hypothetical protein [Ignavibacteria bacterium]
MSKIIITSLIPFLLLIGCINYEQTTRLKSDGSGEMEIHYWTELKNLQMIAKDSYVSFEEDTVRKNLRADNVLIRELKIWNSLEDSTKHVFVKLEFSDIMNLNSTIFFENSDIEFKESVPGQKIYKQKMIAFPLGSTSLEKYTATYNFYFPGEIITDNAFNKDGNFLQWSYKLSDMTKERTMTATIKIKEEKSYLNYLLYAIIGLGLIFVIYFLIRRKKLEKSSKID